MFDVSILAAFSAMFCWGFGDFFIQKVVKKVGDIEALVLIGILGSIGLFPFVVSELPQIFAWENLGLLSFVSIVVFVTAILNFESYKKGKLSVVEVLFELELPITCVLGVLFLKETFSQTQLLLMSMIFTGIIFIATKSLSHFRKIEKGVIFAVLAAIGMAFINFSTAVGSRLISPVAIIWVPWTVFTIICLIIIWKREGLQKLWKNTKKFKIIIIPMGILDTVAWVFYSTAVLQNEVGITSAIVESYVSIALLLGVIVNKEKIKIHQYFGAALALTGSILLAIVV